MDHRIEPRFHLNSPARLLRLDAAKSETTCSLIDLSATGLRAVVDAPLPAEEIVLLELEDHVIVAEIRYAIPRGGRYALGLRRLQDILKTSFPESIEGRLAAIAESVRYADARVQENVAKILRDHGVEPPAPAPPQPVEQVSPEPTQFQTTPAEAVAAESVQAKPEPAEPNLAKAIKYMPVQPEPPAPEAHRAPIDVDPIEATQNRPHLPAPDTKPVDPLERYRIEQTELAQQKEAKKAESKSKDKGAPKRVPMAVAAGFVIALAIGSVVFYSRSSAKTSSASSTPGPAPVTAPVAKVEAPPVAEKKVTEAPKPVVETKAPETKPEPKQIAAAPAIVKPAATAPPPPKPVEKAVVTKPVETKPVASKPEPKQIAAAPPIVKPVTTAPPAPKPVVEKAAVTKPVDPKPAVVTPKPAANGGTHVVQMKVLVDCWVAASSDGKAQFAKMLKAGETHDLRFSQRGYIHIGNAAGVEVSVDGKLAASLGAPKTLRLLKLDPNGAKVVPWHNEDPVDQN